MPPRKRSGEAKGANDPAPTDATAGGDIILQSQAQDVSDVASQPDPAPESEPVVQPEMKATASHPPPSKIKAPVCLVDPNLEPNINLEPKINREAHQRQAFARWPRTML